MRYILDIATHVAKLYAIIPRFLSYKNKAVANANDALVWPDGKE